MRIPAEINNLKEIWKELNKLCKEGNFEKAKEMVIYYMGEDLNDISINRTMLDVVKTYKEFLPDLYTTLLNDIESKVGKLS